MSSQNVNKAGSSQLLNTDKGNPIHVQHKLFLVHKSTFTFFDWPQEADEGRMRRGASSPISQQPLSGSFRASREELS